jgi:hypothetical protein
VEDALGGWQPPAIMSDRLWVCRTPDNPIYSEG